MNYNIYSLDVWGNEEDGFDVNDMHKIGDIELSDNDTSETLLDQLCSSGILVWEAMTLAQVVWENDGFIEINQKCNGKPVLQLRGE